MNKFLLFSLIIFVSCSNYYEINEPDVNVSTENHTYMQGEPVEFQFSGQSDYILFFSGEYDNDFRYRDVNRMFSAKLHLSFTTRTIASSSIETIRNPAYTAISYSSDFNGCYDLSSMNSANWTDITERFILPDANKTVPKGNVEEVSTGAIDISDCFLFSEKPIYIRFHYNVQKYDKQKMNGRTTIQIKDFAINSISEEGAIPIYQIDQINWGFVEGETWAAPENNGKTYLPGEYDNVQFQSEWAPNESREIWAIAGPIYQDDMSSGFDLAKCIKVVADPMLKTFKYTYTQEGTFNPTFVAINSNFNGKKEIVLSTTLNIIPSEGSIIQPDYE